MTDAEAIEFLKDKLGSKAAVAAAIGVSQQVLNNWVNEGRGIAYAKRPVVWAKVNDFGGDLPRDWLADRRP